jgi:hypothetical protein
MTLTPETICESLQTEEVRDAILNYCKENCFGSIDTVDVNRAIEHTVKIIQKVNELTDAITQRI